MLEVRDIWKSYEGQPLLCGVSLQVARGETVCLLGASGSGKSTLLRIIAGLEEAEQGQVLWEGRDLAGIPAHRRGFGLMFQDYALFPHKSVYDNVAFGLRMQGVPQAEQRERVREALDQVNMEAFARRRVTDLSGGEQQRVALARALAPRPRLLMFDEPLGALDGALKEQVEQELRRMLHATGIPAIYVTHDQEEAFAIADRLVLLNRGVVEQDGPPAQVFDRPHTPWVARFLGLSNLLPGRLLQTDPAQVETDLGRFQGEWTGADHPAAGASVMALLRPNAARLLPAPSGEGASRSRSEGFAGGHENQNRLHAVVEDSVFRGDGFRLNVKAGNGQVFSFYTGRAHNPGEPLLLELDPNEVQFLPGEAA